MEPKQIVDGVWGVETTIKVGGGLTLPLRMTVLRDGDDGLILVSPIPIDDDLAASLASLGEVRTLLAPNLLHHKHLASAVARYPNTRLLGVPGLEKKYPNIEFGEIKTGQLSDDIDAVGVDGAPKLSEFVFLHKSSRSLVVTDLVFNIPKASGMSWFLLTTVSRALGKVEQSRLIRWLTSDRAAAGQSIETILALPFDRVIPAHGEVIERDAKNQLRAGLWWMRGESRRPTNL